MDISYLLLIFQNVSDQDLLGYEDTTFMNLTASVITSQWFNKFMNEIRRFLYGSQGQG